MSTPKACNLIAVGNATDTSALMPADLAGTPSFPVPYTKSAGQSSRQILRIRRYDVNLYLRR